MSEIRKILVIAIARSGHHAVMHWLCNLFQNKVIFHNNCNQTLGDRGRKIYNKGCEEVGALVYSFENFDLEGFKYYDWGFDDIIIVNRDPYNLIASSLAKGTKLSVLTEPIPNSRHKLIYDRWWCESLSRYDMFFQYMEQCLGEKDYLGRNFYHINYNEWFVDSGYRKEICSWFNVPYSEKGLNHVSRRGKGSSFDKLKYSGRGSEMDVLNRWKHYENDERFIELVSHPKIKQYSKKYFNLSLEL